MAKLPDKLRAAKTVEIKQRTPGVEGLKTSPSMFLADQNRLYDAAKTRKSPAKKDTDKRVARGTWSQKTLNA